MTAGGQRRPAALAWAVWGLAAGFYCYGFFQRVAPSVMVGELMREFAVGATITGMLSALYFYTYAGLQIPIGLLVDRFGPRRLLASAAALAALGSALFATADDLLPAYAGRLLIGAGAGVSWVGALTLAARWFPPQRFALLSGLTLAMGMAGAVGGQAPLAAAVQAVGWRGTLWGAAAAAAVLAMAMWLIVRDQPHGHAAARKDDRAGSLLEGLRVVLTNPQTHIVGLFGAMLTAPMLSFGGLWGVPYMMQAHALTRPAAALAASAMMVGWGIGAPLAGWFTDFIGRRRLPMLALAGGSLASMTAAIYLPGLAVPAVVALLFVNGLFSGGMVICFATAREHSPEWAAGATLGVVNTAVMATGAIFQPLIGWLLDLQWDGSMVEGGRVYAPEAFRQAFVVLLLCQATAIGAALAVRETWCRQQR